MEPQLKEAIGDALYEVLVDVCGGESLLAGMTEASTERNEWLKQIYALAKSSISFPNHAVSNKIASIKPKQSAPDPSSLTVEGKPHDVEVRAALTFFHRFRETSPATATESYLKVVSNLGLQRTFESPLMFAQALCPALEERCSIQGICHHVQSSSSGIICIVTPKRTEVLRKAGRLPCPQCIQWCKGERGLWWHQQKQHASEYSVATAAAAKQQTLLALIPYVPASHFGKESPVVAVKTASAQHTLQSTQPSCDDPLDAVKQGNLSELRRKVESGLDPSCLYDSKGATPLMWAAGGGHVQVVKFLIDECGCNPNQAQRGKRAFEGRTALHWAARNGHVKVVEYLVDVFKVDLESKTTDGTTSFCWAAWQAHRDVMDFLFRKMANIHATNSFGCNAVLWCAQGKGDADTMSWLADIGCDATLINSNGHGVLHKAAQRGHQPIAEWMFSFVREIATNSEHHKLENINTKGSKDHVQGLLDLVGPDADGCCPSDLAGMEGHEALAVWLVSQEVLFVRSIVNSLGRLKNQGWLAAAQGTNSKFISSGHFYWEPWAGARRMRAALFDSYASSSS